MEIKDILSKGYNATTTSKDIIIWYKEEQVKRVSYDDWFDFDIAEFVNEREKQGDK